MPDLTADPVRTILNPAIALQMAATRTTLVRLIAGEPTKAKAIAEFCIADVIRCRLRIPPSSGYVPRLELHQGIALAKTANDLEIASRMASSVAGPSARGSCPVADDAGGSPFPRAGQHFPGRQRRGWTRAGQ